MVGESVVMKRNKLEDLLTEKELHQIVKKIVQQDNWEILKSKVAPAVEGIAGFLGDHQKVTLFVKVEDRMEKINLFVKRMPSDNKPKAEFIIQNNFFKREMVMFQLLEQMKAVEGDPCYTKALLYNDSILVMPDINVEGYCPRPPLEIFDMPHVLVAINSIAKFHATMANYDTEKNVDGTYNFLDKYGHILTDPTFQASPWLRAAAKLTANLLNVFSAKYIQQMEEKLYNSFVTACDSITEYKDTINVVIHKDLWANNIMFRYQNGEPVNAILIDFQCIRYAPPTFDVMIFLYLNTTRNFREKHETHLLQSYYIFFMKYLDDVTKQRVEEMGYDRDAFLDWCERSRMFGMLVAICLFPYVLMDPITAQKTYDDPVTFDKYLGEDRTEPVVAYANENPLYKQRQVEMAEEYVERYLMVQP